MTDESPRETKDGVRLAVKASTGLVNIGTLAAASMGAAALQSWPLFALGGLAYGALVAWDLVSKDFRERVLGKSRPPRPMLADPASYSDPQTRAAVRTLHAAKVDIDRTLAKAGPELQGHLSMALVGVDELFARSANLAARAEELARYLGTVDPRVVQQDVESIEQRIRAARDASAKSQLEAALAARREHVQALGDLGAAKERIDATLLTLSATLEALPAKVVRMSTLDAEAMDQLTGDVREELAQMNGEIKTFEETLRSIGEIGQP